jgi:hypothetical protein
MNADGADEREFAERWAVAARTVQVQHDAGNAAMTEWFFASQAAEARSPQSQMLLTRTRPTATAPPRRSPAPSRVPHPPQGIVRRHSADGTRATHCLRGDALQPTTVIAGLKLWWLLQHSDIVCDVICPWSAMRPGYECSCGCDAEPERCLCRIVARGEATTAYAAGQCRTRA